MNYEANPKRTTDYILRQVLANAIEDIPGITVYPFDELEGPDGEFLDLPAAAVGIRDAQHEREESMTLARSRAQFTAGIKFRGGLGDYAWMEEAGDVFKEQLQRALTLYRITGSDKADTDYVTVVPDRINVERTRIARQSDNAVAWALVNGTIDYISEFKW